ncbi:MAG: serine/threonine protein kinase [Polyangiaceae bacterium]|nr:serine/threonine protein kinase [Polyangiaceae bacterium]
MVQRKEGMELVGTSYRLLRRIGAGSSSEVYEVAGRRGERRALKVLRPQLVGSREAASRLAHEVRALAALDHPRVVRVEDAGVTADGRPFLVMPLLSGETLRERLDRRGPLSTGAAVAMTLEVLEGLSAAHRAGIVHRDIKPANVFLARPGAAGPGRRARRPSARAPEAAILLDFGVAKVIGDACASTDDHVLGTPRYLAPEQILGGRVDARTDVYAVGLLLFEAIAGRGPFPVPDVIDAMRAHLYTPPPRLGALLGVPDSVDRAVSRAMAKAPAKRWQTAAAMADALLGRDAAARAARPRAEAS